MSCQVQNTTTTPTKRHSSTSKIHGTSPSSPVFSQRKALSLINYSSPTRPEMPVIQRQQRSNSSSPRRRTSSNLGPGIISSRLNSVSPNGSPLQRAHNPRGKKLDQARFRKHLALKSFVQQGIRTVGELRKKLQLSSPTRNQPDSPRPTTSSYCITQRPLQSPKRTSLPKLSSPTTFKPLSIMSDVNANPYLLHPARRQVQVTNEVLQVQSQLSSMQIK